MNKDTDNPFNWDDFFEEVLNPQNDINEFRKEPYVNKDDINEFINFIIENDFNNSNENINKLNTYISKLYKDNKRHLYSDISFIMYDLYITNQDIYSLNELHDTIESIIKNQKSLDDKNKDKFIKFCDHVLLEYKRITSISSMFVDSQTLESEISKLTKELEDKNKEFKKTSEELEDKTKEIEDSLKNNMVSSITIFTIFSAIILVFSGSLTISTGFVEALDNNILDLLILLSILGFIFTNTVFMLFYLVNKMSFKDTNLSIDCNFACDEPTSKNKSVKCGNKYCNNHKKEPRSKNFCILRKKYPFIFCMNIILLIILFISSGLTCIYKYKPDLWINLFS